MPLFPSIPQCFQTQAQLFRVSTSTGLSCVGNEPSKLKVAKHMLTETGKGDQQTRQEFCIWTTETLFRSSLFKEGTTLTCRQNPDTPESTTAETNTRVGSNTPRSGRKLPGQPPRRPQCSPEPCGAASTPGAPYSAAAASATVAVRTEKKRKPRLLGAEPRVRNRGGGTKTLHFVRAEVPTSRSWSWSWGEREHKSTPEGTDRQLKLMTDVSPTRTGSLHTNPNPPRLSCFVSLVSSLLLGFIS